MIYFVQLESMAIKIGTTENVSERLAQLEDLYKSPVSLLGTIPGGRREELELHRRFAHLRFGKTEQFRPAPDLMEFIGKPLLVSQNPNAIERTVSVRDTSASIRINAYVLMRVKIAAAYKGVSITEFVNRAILGAADRDIEQEISKEDH
jgi:hypothetical protein